MKIHLFLFALWFAGFSSCANSNRTLPENKDNDRLGFTGQTFENLDISSLGRNKKEGSPRILEFDQCTFKGTTSFGPLPGVYQVFSSSAIFKNCSFEGEVQGNMLQFLGQLSFGKCRFTKAFNAQNSVFHAPAGFRECTFDGDAQFQNAIFFKESTWQGTHFYGIPLFQSVRFFEKAQFSNAVLHSNSDFSLCRFSEGASFDFVRAEGNLDFSDSRQEGMMTFRKAIFQKRISLDHFRSFALLRFLDTSFGDSLTQKGAQFFAEKPEIQSPTGKTIPAFNR